MRVLLLLFACLAILFGQSGFWQQWGDGQAEVSGYDLIVPRYGEPRRGTAVTIFVTEPFSNSLRVKADDGRHPAQDVFPVLKLNLIKDFQTGVYDYHDMLSSFVALAPVNGRPAGTITKASFSRQEWCGHTFQMALFDSSKVRVTRHSYFDGEADQAQQLPHLPNSLADDAVFFWARGYSEPALKPGEQRSVQYLTSSEHGRGSLEWKQALLKRSPVAMRIQHDGQTVEAEKVTVQIIDGVKKEFTVERGGQRRILAWEFSNGEKATLLKSARLKYWEMNKKGMEGALRQLGLVGRPPRTT
ncbi:MAG: hypothetical protein K2Q23_02255 [Bryobacteraceae bacterium]|nr:hypothetical protein [Bryobacteraceae bacterium]